MADKTNGITKMEGVRRALKALGKAASAADIQTFLKDNFDMEMTKDHIYVAKGQVIRQKAKRKAAGRKSAARTKEPSKGSASKAGRASAKARGKGQKVGISKLEAVRRALKALGKKAGSEAIQGYLKEHFDLELTRDRITKSKSLVLGKARRARKKKRAARAGSPVQSSVTSATAKKSSKDKGEVQMNDLEAVKALVKRVGPEQLQTLIDLLDK